MTRSLLFACLLTAAVPAFAGPQGGAVIDGAATIGTAGKITTITQATSKAIINWQRFESTASETIRFQQPGASSLTLNRVVGVDPSFLGGALQANGGLFILNPNGILFGPTSVVNVNSLVASTLSISDADFTNGNFVFVQGFNQELSSVINRGSITAATGGTVALIAPIVDNSGTIVAAAGRVVIKASASGSLVGPSGSGSAIGRHVRMAEAGLTPLLADVVNTSSLTAATKIDRLGDGTVFLRGAGGIAVQGGRISAPGGTVTIDADVAIGLGGGGIVNAGTGTTQVTALLKDIKFTPAGGPANARAVLQGDTLTVNAPNGQILSNAAGSLELRGANANVNGVLVGTPTAPIRTNVDRITAFSEGQLGVISDGSLTADVILALGNSSVTVAGDLLAGAGRTSGLQFFSPPSTPVHVGSISGRVAVRAGGSVGTVAAPLTVQRVDVASGTDNTVASSPFTIALGAHSFTLLVDNSGPVARTAFTPPIDVPDAPEPPAATPVVQLPALTPVSNDAAAGVVTVVSQQSVTPRGPDNILVSASASRLVKSEGSDSSAAPAVDVQEAPVASNEDPEDEERGAGRVASRPTRAQRNSN